MIAHLLTALVAASDGNGGVLLLLGPLAGGGLYYGLWRHYRNTDKSHSFETETKVLAQPITGNDRKVDEIKRTTKTGIDGDNKSSHRQRVQRTP